MQTFFYITFKKINRHLELERIEKLNAKRYASLISQANLAFLKLRGGNYKFTDYGVQLNTPQNEFIAYAGELSKMPNYLQHYVKDYTI